MHDFEVDPQAIQRRTVAPSEPTEATPAAALPPGRARRSVHGEASLLHLQRTAGNASVVQMLADEAAEQEGQDASPVHDVIGSGGAPLEGSLRGSMESRFGQDFGDVRVHTDARASASAESVGANAYTVGNDVVFKSGSYDPASSAGQRTLAHELSHVVQQRSGPVDGTDAPGGIRVSDPSDRFERAADATADQVVSGSSSTSTGAPSVQMEEDDDAEVPVQRQEGPEEEEDDDAVPA